MSGPAHACCSSLEAVATEIHFKSWSKELKSFMHGKKTEDYLIRDRWGPSTLLAFVSLPLARHGHNIQWHDSTIEPPASDQFPLVILHRQAMLSWKYLSTAHHMPEAAMKKQKNNNKKKKRRSKIRFFLNPF